MFHLKKEKVLGIDHTYTSIDPEQFSENCQNYLNSVAAAIDAALADPQTETEYTAKVRKFILEHSKVDIGKEGSALIQKGLLKGG